MMRAGTHFSIVHGASRVAHAVPAIAALLCVARVAGSPIVTKGPAELPAGAVVSSAAAPDSSATNSSPPDLTMPQSPAAQAEIPGGPESRLLEDFVSNTASPSSLSDGELLEHLKKRLEIARYLRSLRRPADAEPILVELLDDRTPDWLKRSAFLELAAAVQDENDLPRSVQIYAQFLNRWSEDLRVPEVLLRQGILFRQMGLNNLALSKFYSVMTSALILKNDRLDYYERLVAQAQTEIAETHFQLGKFAEAADFYSRLSKLTNSLLDQPKILYRLVLATDAVKKYDQAAVYAQEFLDRFPRAPEQPEVRFHLAMALKQLGRNNDSLQQVLTLLREQRERTADQPAVWAYWQQRTGNLIANQLYREGDYARALQIYLDLSQLDGSPEWQLPLQYQIGLTYEQLLQPEKATATYDSILGHEKDWGAMATPGQKSVFDMARWRKNFVSWQSRADAANHNLRISQ